MSIRILEYYAGEVGGVCNQESHVIRTMSECRTAKRKFGFTNVDNVGEWSDKSESIPSGCSIRNGGNFKLHFETSPTGLGVGRYDLLPLCAKNIFGGIMNSKIISIFYLTNCAFCEILYFTTNIH